MSSTGPWSFVSPSSVGNVEGGAFGLAGNVYFHNTSSFNDQLTLGGNSASNTFVVGDIVVDELYLHGNPSLEMDLNPNALYYVIKASLLQ